MTRPRVAKKVEGDPSQLVFLIVDDDGQVREILNEFLNSFGFKNVVQAKDGKAALKIIQNHNQRLDFIISDWEMPHIDGLTLLRAVRKDQTRENVKFLIVSSQSSRERIKISEAAKAYVDAYVVKPFRAHILKEKINNLIVHGIDKSAEEFESSLEVPSNEQSGNVGNVDVADAASETPPSDVTVQDLDGETGHVQNVESAEMPPEQYDLTQMNVALVVKLAKAYLKVKWIDKAMKLCEDALVQFPETPDLICQQAHCQILKGDNDQAMALLKTVTKLKPYHVEAQTLIAEIQSKSKAA